MNDIFEWFMVMANNKAVTVIIFIVTFLAIIVYVYGNKKRSARLEEYRNIPFLDDEPGRTTGQLDEHQHIKGEK
jgi:cbb3-type cytochrome oxidase subunit 3